MWRVNRPHFDVGQTFDLCINIIRSSDLRLRMENARCEILKRSVEYEKKAKLSQLSLIGVHEHGVSSVAGIDLKKNYTSRMARKGVPARPVYDALKILPRHNRCPFCNYGPVETLDHLLPKTQYPAFSVLPINLVGCCDRCNRLKWETIPTSPGDVYLHPYFDGVDDVNWLKAEIVESRPAAAVFYVDADPGLTSEQVSRIEAQFNRLMLAKLYSDASADEIVDVSVLLTDLFLSGGPEVVKEHLLQQHRSRLTASRNSWRSSLYAALSKSEWYCNGGFQIGD